MTNDRDDDAFRWDGDADPTLDAPAPRAKLPRGFTPVGKGAADVDEDDGETTSDSGAETAAREDADEPAAASETDTGEADAAAAEPAHTGNATLVTIGVLAGIAAMWTIGWVIGGLRLQGTAEFLVSPLAYIPSLWLAALAPAIWFGAVWLLTRRSRAWVRVSWLVAGAVLLVPWPFVMTGTVGS
ncbi:DNA polymerase III subunit gamma/tau [Microbacterium thalassium]|uniref:DNA polymerase III subunit gamma/tau n=1 Tax=Microbacterium thalassium TaxID=362649 RepID=A0A7X0KVF5_9MICO|nr:DNA polymerase III subunit gamma/tau [Microbacterium thalassium]MBB6392190.1 hypothetical protein [Microbacterium thalassium]GLK23401.1 hypothetical protein GCM10017607_07190 [Microbacterium thalassium]